MSEDDSGRTIELQRGRTPEENSAAIDDSPALVLAEQDLELLQRDELRPVRLQLELLKPELGFQEHHIRSTIVLFGGTRVVAEPEARARLEEIEAQLAAAPDDETLRAALPIARRVLAKSHYYDEARELSAIISRACQTDQCREFVVVTGGGPGVMEAGNRGAFESGKMSIGLSITLPFEERPNAYVTPELCYRFHYFAIRKMHFLMRARGLVAFPGGFGTLDELFEALTLLQTRKIEPVPVILYGREFWQGAINWQHFVDEGTIHPRDLDLFSYADTPREAWEILCAFHGLNPDDTREPA